MIQSIISSISEKLNSIFGDDYRIYTEATKQGLQEPCFFIQLIDASSRHECGRRYFRENLFCIQYFPLSKDDPKAECYRVQERLYTALEYITVNETLQRGIKKRGEFTDGFLSFFVNYNVYVTVPDEVDNPMHTLEPTQIGTKG